MHFSINVINSIITVNGISPFVHQCKACSSKFITRIHVNDVQTKQTTRRIFSTERVTNIV